MNIMNKGSFTRSKGLFIQVHVGWNIGSFKSPVHCVTMNLLSPRVLSDGFEVRIHVKLKH